MLTVLLVVGTAVSAERPLAAAEFRPVAVWTDAEWYPNSPGKYAPGTRILLPTTSSSLLRTAARTRLLKPPRLRSK